MQEAARVRNSMLYLHYTVRSRSEYQVPSTLHVCTIKIKEEKIKYAYMHHTCYTYVEGTYSYAYMYTYLLEVHVYMSSSGMHTVTHRQIHNFFFLLFSVSS